MLLISCMAVSNLFSSREMSFINDQEFLLAKREISKKIYLLLGQVEQELQQVIGRYLFPADVLIKSGKISRGDSYRGLPYMVLDYPRVFRNEHVFAFRTMFWWGHHFSSTLHLSGTYLQNSRSRLIQNISQIAGSKAYVCVHSDPWEYHFDGDNYRPATGFKTHELLNLIKEKPFVKISYQWPLEEFCELPHEALRAFRELAAWTLKSKQRD